MLYSYITTFIISIYIFYNYNLFKCPNSTCPYHVINIACGIRSMLKNRRFLTYLIRSKEMEKNVYEKYFENKGVMITGGLGFIGSNLACKLVELKPKKIIIVDSLIQGQGGNINNVRNILDKIEIPNKENNGIDINNKEKILELLEDIDCIFNLAGSVSHIDSKKKPLEDLKLNLESHVAFLEACREFLQKNPDKKMKIVFTNTRDIYGKIKEEFLPVKENLLVEEMSDPQGIHNYSAEFYHLWYTKNFNIQGCSLRLTNTYGPRQRIDKPEQGFLGYFIYKALKNETIELWGKGEVLRDFNYVDDVVDALLMSMASPYSNGKIYNLGCFIRKNAKYQEIGNNIVSVGDAARLVVKVALSGKLIEIPYPEDKQSIEPGHVYLDATKLYKEIGWEPRTNFEDGIKKTIMFYRENKDYWNNEN